VVCSSSGPRQWCAAAVASAPGPHASAPAITAHRSLPCPAPPPWPGAEWRRKEESVQQLEAASAQAAEVTPCSWSMTLRGANERLVPLGNAYISGLYVSKKDPYKSGRWVCSRGWVGDVGAALRPECVCVCVGGGELSASGHCWQACMASRPSTGAWHAT
jgi:hypothetical protein